MKQIYALILSLTVLFCACGKQAPDQDVTTITKARTVALNPLVKEADPETALEKIYESVEIEDVQEADAQALSKDFAIEIELLEDYAARYTSGRFGLADVFILKPKDPEEGAAKLREQLEQVKLTVSRECEHYDIYNAYQIAQDAQVFEQGGYVILLMLADNESARNVIDLYIPKN